jgi:hypothetical protein
MSTQVNPYTFVCFDRGVQQFVVHGAEMSVTNREVRDFGGLLGLHRRYYPSHVVLGIFYNTFMNKVHLQGICMRLVSQAEVWRLKFNSAVESQAPGMFRTQVAVLGLETVNMVLVMFNGQTLSGVSPWYYSSAWGKQYSRHGDVAGVVRVAGYIAVFNELFGSIGNNAGLML